MVKIIKLQNNCEIIGSMVEDNNDSVVIDNPFSINYMFTAASDRPIIGLLRYMPFAEERQMSFQKSGIINIANARTSMSNYYDVILDSHLSDIDDHVDNELQGIVDSDFEDENNSDTLQAILEKMNTNDRMH
jgi:hypothetical protein